MLTHWQRLRMGPLRSGGRSNTAFVDLSSLVAIPAVPANSTVEECTVEDGGRIPPISHKSSYILLYTTKNKENNHWLTAGFWHTQCSQRSICSNKPYDSYDSHDSYDSNKISDFCLWFPMMFPFRMFSLWRVDPRSPSSYSYSIRAIRAIHGYTLW